MSAIRRHLGKNRAFLALVSLIARLAVKLKVLPQDLILTCLIIGIKAEGRTMVSKRRLRNLHSICTHPGLPPGSFVECGIARGGCVALMSFCAASKRTVWGFDSFEGLPSQTPEDESSGDDQVGRVYSGPDGFHEAQNTLKRFHVAGPRVTLVPGWFENTLPQYISQLTPIAVLRLDNDWYKSTLYCLETLYDSVASGGTIIVDDYHAYLGCRKAVDEFRTARGISSSLQGTQGNSEVFWVKEEKRPQLV